MEKNYAEEILIKYLTGQASENDIEVLSEWIKLDNNQEIFDEYVKIHFKVSTSMQYDELNDLKDVLKFKQPQSTNEKSKTFRISRFYKYAALVVVMIIAGFYTTSNFILPYFNQNKPITNEDRFVTIETASGEKIQLKDTDKSITSSNGDRLGDQTDGKLIYDTQQTNGEPITVTLSIPYGKTFKVVLADGTRVHLNSGSTLSYPTFFTNNQPRSISLTGEAYFEVKKDTLHPFVVNSQDMKVEVLGTHFNISNYHKENFARTVLLEGSVKITESSRSNGIVLNPNQMAEKKKYDSEIKVKEVNPEFYVAWTQGKLIFRNNSFDEICRVLERKYAVQIKLNNEQLKAEIFDASFDIETIEEVLESFQRSYDFKFRKVDDQIQID